MTTKKECVLYDKECDGCGECMFCDLDPTKICDNCGKCVEIKDDYAIKVSFDDPQKNTDET
ncbi:MAG: hypothetical protein ILP02_00550 [Clostridia bacterium]|nr:hypothetical protein [Clostridia bacterium]